jgi:hypothetical protein
VRRLLELQRQIRELKKEFAPPPSPPDSAQALRADLWSTWILIILFHSHSWNRLSDGLEEIFRLLGIAEVVNCDLNIPGVNATLNKLLCKCILTNLRDLVERRGGKWPNDEVKLFFNDDMELLYSEIPVELKNGYCLPRELVDFYSRVEALVEQI